MNRPEVHDVLRRWRALADADDPRPDPRRRDVRPRSRPAACPFYGTGEDELNLAFNFLFVHAELEAAALRDDRRGRRGRAAADVLAGVDGLQPRRGPARRRAGPAAIRRGARPALLMLLTLRGTPFLYYGDEIGLPDVPLDPADALDPVARRTGDPAQPRPVPHADAVDRRGRAPGSPTPGVEPWLPFGDAAACNVAAQREDPDSTLHLVRDLIALRRDARRTCAAAPTLARRRPTGPGRGGAATASPSRSTSSDAQATVDGLEGTIASGPTAPATARRSAAR